MKYIKIFLIIYLLFFFSQYSVPQELNTSEEDAISLITQMVIKNMDKLPNKRLAVIEFTDINGQPTEIGKLLAERIITRLVQHKEVNVVERSKVNKLLEEQNLSLAGLTDSDTAKVIGKILNIDALLTGTLIQVRDYIEINARMINTENALVLTAIRVNDKSISGTELISGSKSIAAATIKSEEKKSAEAPRVDITEYKIEKIAEGLGKNYSTIKITGKAVFIQSAGKEKFKDLISMPVFNLIDSGGNKIMEFKGSFKCGEYGNEENIKPQKPFPFTAEDGLVKKEFWEKTAACQFIKWGFVK